MKIAPVVVVATASGLNSLPSSPRNGGTSQTPPPSSSPLAGDSSDEDPTTMNPLLAAIFSNPCRLRLALCLLLLISVVLPVSLIGIAVRRTFLNRGVALPSSSSPAATATLTSVDDTERREALRVAIGQFNASDARRVLPSTSGYARESVAQFAVNATWFEIAPPATAAPNAHRDGSGAPKGAVGRDKGEGESAPPIAGPSYPIVSNRPMSVLNTKGGSPRSVTLRFPTSSDHHGHRHATLGSSADVPQRQRSSASWSSTTLTLPLLSVDQPPFQLDVFGANCPSASSSSSVEEASRSSTTTTVAGRSGHLGLCTSEDMAALCLAEGRRRGCGAPFRWRPPPGFAEANWANCRASSPCGECVYLAGPTVVCYQLTLNGTGLQGAVWQLDGSTCTYDAGNMTTWKRQPLGCDNRTQWPPPALLSSAAVDAASTTAAAIASDGSDGTVNAANDDDDWMVPVRFLSVNDPVIAWERITKGGELPLWPSGSATSGTTKSTSVGLTDIILLFVAVTIYITLVAFLWREAVVWFRRFPEAAIALDNALGARCTSVPSGYQRAPSAVPLGDM